MNLGRTRLFFSAAALALSSGLAHAAGAPAAPAGTVDVDLPRVLAPMVVDGRLQGYLYLSISLVPASPGQVLAIREKVHFLQDVFVRELNLGSILKADDPKVVDVEATKARLMTRVHEVLPANAVSDMKFDQIVFAPLKPE